MFDQSKTFGNTSFGQPGSFGGGTAFGAGTTGFGTTGTGGFATPASGSLFGATATATPSGGLFGTQPTAFGAAGTGSSFSFGATAQTAGLFSSAAVPTATTSLFGNAATTAPTGSIFGATPAKIGFGGTATTAANGTTVKFAPPAGTESMLKGGNQQNINTRHQCITAMKEYETKSIEELRLEDYVANRKGVQQGTAAIFGAAQPTATPGFSFGQNKTTTFAGGFGAAPASTSLFGAQTTQPQGSTLFGGATAAKPVFGTATTSAAAPTGFGGFGTSTGSSLFGGATQQKSIFGQTATTQSGGLFGGTQTSTAFGTAGFGTPSVFGATTQAGGLFGNKATGFGTPSASTGFSFGQPATTSSLFAKPTTTGTTGFGGFGATSNAGFGTTQTSSLFGNKPTGFGTALNPLSTGFAANTGLAGTLGTGTTSMFGGQMAKPTLGLGTTFGGGSFLGGVGTGTTLGGLGGVTAPPTAASDLAAQAQVQQQLLGLTNSPYGDSPLFRNLKPDDKKREELVKPTNPAAQKAALTGSSQYKVSPRPASKIKPRPLHSIANGKMQMFEGLEDDDASFCSESFVARRSIKKLQLNKPSGRRDNHLHSILNSPSCADDQFAHFSHIPSSEMLAQSEERSGGNQEKGGFASRVTSEDEIAAPHIATKNLDNTIEELNPRSPLRTNLNKLNRLIHGETMSEHDLTTISLPQETDGGVAHPAGVQLARPGYYTLPPMEELGTMVDENGLCVVENFVVGREGYGNVLWPGNTDVAYANLDNIVHFRRKEITVYPDDDNKPPMGEGFNKKAQVTLDCVWPIDKSCHTPIKSPRRLQEMEYQEKLERASVKIGATFIDYRPETGSWVFEVKHFSKYGLLDDSDDEDTTIVKPSKPKQLKLTPLLPRQAGKEPAMGEDDLLKKMDTSDEKIGSQSLVPSDDGGIIEKLIEDTTMDAQSDSSVSDDGEYGPGETPVPASYRLADSMGVFAEDIQLKKASFFGDDDDFEPVPEWGRPKPPYVGRGSDVVLMGKTPTAWKGGIDRMQPSSPITPSVTSLHKKPIGNYTSAASLAKSFGPSPPHQMLLPSGMAEYVRPHRLVGSRIHHRVPPLELSVAADRHNVVMDMGLLRGRSFRVGWGPCWVSAHRGEPFQWQTGCSALPIGELFVPSPPASDFQVVLEHLERGLPRDISNDKLLRHTEEWLKIQLNHCEHAIEGDCPVFVARPGIDMLRLYANNLQEAVTDAVGAYTMKQDKLVWDLCVALWGDVTELLLEKGVSEASRNSYEYQDTRKTAFSRWLADATAQATNDDLAQAKPGSLQKTFLLLAAHQMAKACECAQENDNHRLALALSMPPGAHVPRQMFFKQLSDWQNVQMEPFIDKEVLKVYCLQSGLMTWTTPLIHINTCEHLDWKRALAIHFWYQCMPTEGIADALKSYDAAFHGDKAYASPPMAPYVTNETSLSHSELDAYDTCYHLLKLYCDKRYPLHEILAPSTHTSAPLDHHLSWHLSQALYALEYKNLTVYQVGCLHTSYAAQLESLGLWHWAVFVLLHLTDSHQREHDVREVLTRHVGLESSEDNKARESFLQNELHIPPKWIHHAKAIRGRSERRYEHEAWHLQKAGLLNESHDIILKHIAPDAIINENYNYLKRFLVGLRDAEDESSMKDWKTEGAVYMDYINMMQTLSQLKEGEPSGHEVERLQVEVISLMSRIDQIKCDSALHRLCQSEMAKRADNLMLTLLIMQHPTQPLPTRFFAQELGTMHLPEDYALQRLGQLTRSYMQELSAS